MRISDIFTTESKQKRKFSFKKFFLLGGIMAGIISGVIIFVTFYGQYTGTFTLSMQRDLMDKGIELADNFEFMNPRSTLSVEPLTEIGDMLGTDIDVDGARNKDGQFYDQRVPYYIAYTFYIRNSGSELVNVDYRLRLLDSYKGVEKAVKIRLISENLKTIVVTDQTFSHKEGSNLIIDQTMEQFDKGDVTKFTIFLWFDGEFTDSSMLGGGIKLDFTFTISNAIGA